MHPTLMIMFMDAQKAERERSARNASRRRLRAPRGERR